MAQEAAQNLDTAGEFNSLVANSGNENALTVLASSAAAPGSYEIIINSRAVSQKTLSQIQGKIRFIAPQDLP